MKRQFLLYAFLRDILPLFFIKKTDPTKFNQYGFPIIENYPPMPKVKDPIIENSDLKKITAKTQAPPQICGEPIPNTWDSYLAAKERVNKVKHNHPHIKQPVYSIYGHRPCPACRPQVVGKGTPPRRP